MLTFMDSIIAHDEIPVKVIRVVMSVRALSLSGSGRRPILRAMTTHGGG